MSNYKEIVTKAVIGKAKKISHNDFKMSTEEVPNTVLGCWIINHTFNGSKDNNKVLIKGSFDVNVWYSYDNDSKTKVEINRYGYEDLMQVTLKENASLDNSSEIIVRSLKQPTVTDVNIIDGKIEMNIEKEIGVEIVGNTKLKINVIDEEDEYEVINDEDSVEEIKEDFLES